jgi:Cdc6-like AAA superfamily ATPase
MSSTNYEELSTKALQVFLPASPITTLDLFSGRISQVKKILEAIQQPGRHAVLYGDRGVGKTSLANVLGVMAGQNRQSAIPVGKVNCDGTDTFDSVWRKALGCLTLRYMKPGLGFTAEPVDEIRKLADSLPHEATPNDIRELLASFQSPGILVIFDEFDRLPTKAAKVFTDCIKSLSDYSINTTVVIVGVASTVDQLVRDHASIERALVQVPMPRMERPELQQIVTKGADKLGVSFSVDATNEIVQMSQGLPHYAHLVALHSVKEALRRKSIVVEDLDVEVGIRAAVADAQHTIKNQYHKATVSSQSDALFTQVLLACALATKDTMSCFRASDVAAQLRRIMGRAYSTTAFARHLSEFSTQRRGSVIKGLGEPRRRLYQFVNPLLEPYVVMCGLSSGIISRHTLASPVMD